jgi:hypothetical protein
MIKNITLVVCNYPFGQGGVNPRPLLNPIFQSHGWKGERISNCANHELIFNQTLSNFITSNYGKEMLQKDP